MVIDGLTGAKLFVNNNHNKCHPVCDNDNQYVELVFVVSVDSQICKTQFFAMMRPNQFNRTKIKCIKCGCMCRQFQLPNERERKAKLIAESFIFMLKSCTWLDCVQNILFEYRASYMHMSTEKKIYQSNLISPFSV